MRMRDDLLAGRLRLLRILAGMSQTDLAEALGTPQSKIAYYEAGKVRPRSMAVIDMAALFDCSWEWLYKGKPDAFSFSWSILPPPRYSHLYSMVSDAESVIKQLLPIFCRENNVQHVFRFSWRSLGAVYALVFGGGASACILIIKAEPSMVSVLEGVFEDQCIACWPGYAEQLPENVWDHLFNPESGLEKNKTALRVLLRDLQAAIPERFPDSRLEFCIEKFERRMNTMQKREAWSFPCEITVTREGGIERREALLEIANLLDCYVSRNEAQVGITIKKMADNKFVSEALSSGVKTNT